MLHDGNWPDDHCSSVIACDHILGWMPKPQLMRSSALMHHGRRKALSRHKLSCIYCSIINSAFWYLLYGQDTNINVLIFMLIICTELLCI